MKWSPLGFLKGNLTKSEIIVQAIFGISEENLVKAFEPFFTTKKEGRGTGLGLWVSYGIIKSFQGEIKIESKVNKGTTFIIKLPIH